MKKKIIYGVAALSLVALLTTPFGCKKINPSDYSISVDTDVFSSPMMVFFENARADATKQPEGDFTVKISGDDASKVVTVLGTRDFQAHEGWIALNLAKGVDASVKPVSFILTAKIDGFEEVRKEIVISSKDDARFTIKVIEIGNHPSGVAEETKNIPLTNGVISSDQYLNTIVENGATETVSLKLPSGTKMLNKNGEPISGASMSTNVRFYDVSDESIHVFPGGLAPQLVTDKDGKKIDGGIHFFTAGLMDVDMKIGDDEVKKFSNPIDAEIKINENQDNFTTGQKVKEGDLIPLWSLDELTGQWQEEGTAKVVNSNGSLTAQFKITHLSGWNLDWGWSMFGSYGTKKVKLDVIFETSWVNPTGLYEVTLRSPNGGYLGALHCTPIYDGFVATFESTPNIPLAYIEIYDRVTKKIVHKSAPFNPSTQNKYNVKIADSPLKYVDVSLTYSLVNTKNPKLKPTASAQIIITDLVSGIKTSFFTGSISMKSDKGNIKVRLISGRNYKVSTLGKDGKIISCESVFDINDLSKLKYDKINGLNVKKLQYNATNKTVEIECEYLL